VLAVALSQLVQTIANGAPNDAAVTISEAIGQPAALSKIQGAFQAFNGKIPFLAP
jgi:hypothetical protein